MSARATPDPSRGALRPIRKLLVANRGEIALRVIRTARAMGIATVAVYSDADRTALHVRAAEEAYRIGPPPPRESYLRIDAILAACRASGADAVHPGYGFLSENADLAEALDAAGILFVGPPASAMRAVGDKIAARRAAAVAGVPVVPGAELPEGASDDAAVATAVRVGFPLLVKASGGGGGKGMRLVAGPGEVAESVRRASSEALTAFGNGTVFLERFVARPHHVEIQVLADAHGNVVPLGERECSVQRRHQKVIEESPSPIVSPGLRARMEAAAVAVARSVGYRSAGTVEFLVTGERPRGGERPFYFLEVNTRLQVEHPVTEMRFDVDVVREQIRVARGEALSFAGHVPEPRGHAIEARVCAEDGDRGFLPSTGTLGAIQIPGGPGIRCDGHVHVGQEITLHYDNLLLKIVAHGSDRAEAIARLRQALHESRLPGVTTNLPLLVRTLDDPRFQAGDYDTSILADTRPLAEDPDDLVPALAAALALHRRARGAAIPPARTPGATSPWVLAGRRWPEPPR